MAKIFSILIIAMSCSWQLGWARQLNLEQVLADESALLAGQGVRAQLIAVNSAMLSAGIAGKIT